ncbi:MAG: PspC domain-containing protein [Candidatus Dojkabacteria bacterium]
MADAEKKLTRSDTDKVLTGVCGGLGKYFGIDSNIVRLLFVLGSIFLAGSFVIIYIILAVVLPSESGEKMIK